MPQLEHGVATIDAIAWPSKRLLTTRFSWRSWRSWRAWREIIQAACEQDAFPWITRVHVGSKKEQWSEKERERLLIPSLSKIARKRSPPDPIFSRHLINNLPKNPIAATNSPATIGAERYNSGN